MNDAYVAWRAPICLMALIAGFALPAAAQRTPQQVDQVVTQQQTSLDQLKSSVEQLKQEREALNRSLNELKASVNELKTAKAAPPEAWTALGTVGLVFVLMWGGVTLIRERSRVKEIESETQEKIRTAIARQTELIESATDKRLAAAAKLLGELRTQSTTPVTVKGVTGLCQLLVDLIAGSRNPGRSKEHSNEAR